MTARGGMRPGAGRKRQLDAWDRLALGAACEARFRAAWERAREDAWERKPKVAELRTLQREMNAVPVPERRGFLSSLEGEELAGLIEQAIRDIRRTPDFVSETNRQFELTAPRPKGIREPLIAAVAKEYSERWGVKISNRMVERCWNEHRAIEKSLAQSNDEN